VAATASRVAELESQLATERAEAVRRMQLVEQKIGEFRETVGRLRQEVRQAAADRAERDAKHAEAAALRQESDAARADVVRLEGELAHVRANADERAARIGELERALSAPREESARTDADAAALRADAESARAAVARLEADLAQARAGAAERAARIGELELALAAARSAAPSVAAVGEPVLAGEGFPDVAGLRCEGAGETTPFGARFPARRCSDRLPVDVLVVARADAERLSALALARHANLVSALATGVARDGAYVVLERPAGETLDRAVGRDGPMGELKALRLVRQVAQGLRHAAVHALLHGDLSPATVRLGADDGAQVESVGLGAMLPRAERPLTDARFAAPERLAGADEPDQRADIYSLGALLAFLLTGAPPYEGDREAVQCAHAVGKTYDLRAKRRQVSRETSAIVTTFLALDRADRPQDWDAALGAIESAVARQAGDGASASWLDRLTSTIAGRPALACALAVTPIVLAGLALHLAAHDEPAAQRERAPAPSPRDR
jgi:hypothetical protein